MNQVNLFSFIKETYFIRKPIRLIELFAGIGAQAKALQNLQVDFEHYCVVEIDSSAMQSYNAIFHTEFVVSDITKISARDLGIEETQKYEYIMTYSFPCQDLSKAGKKRGMKKGSGTRSGLLWEVERLLHECEELPQILLMENVPDVIGSKNIQDFQQWMYSLEKLGYSNYVECLNAKNYGIPQNRNRAFMVSILGDYFYEFPSKIPLNKCLKDFLEKKVESFYYLNQKQLEKLLFGKFNQDKRFMDIEGICNTLTTKPIRIVGDVDVSNSETKENVLYGIRPTSRDSLNGIIIRENTRKGYTVAEDGDGIYIDRPHEKRGVVQKSMIQTLKTSCSDVAVVSKSLKTGTFYVRLLTPLESWRLMGFADDDFMRAAKCSSKTQLYKQAGNSIVVNVLEAIFKKFFENR